MKLYKLKQSVNASTIGVFPQVGEKWPWPTDRWGSDSYTMTPLKGPIEFKIIFPQFILEEGAKLTDWVSTVNIQRNYLMVSTRMMDLLKEFILDEYQYFPVPIHTPKSIVDYHLIYFPWPRGDDFIDWGNTIFQRTTDSGVITLERFGNTRERQFAKNKHELSMYQPMLYEEKITCDVFRFLGYDSGFYVSERLKNAMEAAGMTGIVYEVPEWLPE